MKEKIKHIKDIFYFFQGYYRYNIFYSKFTWLLRRHIKEQIKYRIRVMNRTCYEQGSCIKCGCATTALQMCNKSCDGKCYPPLMNREKWDKKEAVYINSDQSWVYSYNVNKYIIYIIKKK